MNAGEKGVVGAVGGVGAALLQKVMVINADSRAAITVAGTKK